MLSGARRVAMLLLLSLLTTATAWADDVTLQTDGAIAEGTAGHYYVNMPTTGTNTLTLSQADITTNGKGVFKVYDDGGKNDEYSNNCDGYLLLKAPVGYIFQLTGEVYSQWNSGIIDYLQLYDGETTAASIINKIRSMDTISEMISERS